MTATQSVSFGEAPTISDAVTAARLGDTGLAARLLDGVLEAHPKSEQALLWKAVLSGSGDEAESYLEQVLEINPSNEQAYRTLTMLRMNREERDETLAALQSGSHGDTPRCCSVCLSALDGESRQCGRCGSIVEIADWTAYVNNQSVDEVLVSEAVARWKEGMERAPSGGTAYLIALGYLNLKRSGEAFEYLQKAENMGIEEPGMADLMAHFEAQHLVLAVESNSLVRRFVSMILTKAGFRVVTAANGDEGLEMFGRLHPDLVVCDYSAPGKNGFEFCRHLRKGGFATPVVLMSGNLVDKLRGRVAGVSDWVNKPFEPELLAATVRRHLAA